MNIFQWIQNEIFRMNWLYNLISRLVEDVFGLDMASRIGESVHFFIYDTIKILILLIVVIFFISFIQSYFPPEKTKRYLGKVSGFRGYLLGALLGSLTPFCSCSSIPIFIGFTAGGLPVGVTFSFLISSPMVDLASFIMLATYFGLPFAGFYVIMGLLLAIVGGFLIDKSGLSSEVMSFTDTDRKETVKALTMKERLTFSYRQAKEIFNRVYLYVLIGVGIGALIHNWIPATWIQFVLGDDNPFAVFIATIIGIPIYADIFGTLPIAEALLTKGVNVGTVVSFMMSVVALSLPSLILLSKVIKPKLMQIFILIMFIGILITGYLLNQLSFLLMP